MINFKTKLSRWEIYDENGSLVNARELPDKSITTETMADEFISTPHYADSYMRALNNQMLLRLFMKYMGSLADYCIEKSKTDKNWDSTYNTGIVYLLDNLIVRYAELFETYDVVSTYGGQNEIKQLYEKAIEGASITNKKREPVDPKDIQNYTVPEVISNIRANSAGFNALIPHYTEKQSLENLTTYLCNCGYSSEQTNFWFIIQELIRRIENNEI